MLPCKMNIEGLGVSNCDPYNPLSKGSGGCVNVCLCVRESTCVCASV